MRARILIIIIISIMYIVILIVGIFRTRLFVEWIDDRKFQFLLLCGVSIAINSVWMCL
jgi:hypothetical protein